ncbi:MAG: aldo/keto reductase [Chloroflexota bacterium]
MEYRRLGRTELRVSLLGVGGGYVMLKDLAYGTRLYERAAELGLNYFDGRYGASSRMIAPVIRGDRARFVITSKTHDDTRARALARVDDDLAELETDYIDVYFLRTYNHDRRQRHFAPGGSLEGLMEARAQGKIRYIGLAGHSDLSALAAGIETGLIDVVIFPLNVVRRDAFEALIPAAQRHDVGLVAMKPMNVGLLTPEVALPWLAHQPIHTMVPGVSSIEQLERNVAALSRASLALSPEALAEVERVRAALDDQTCRICDHICRAACPQDIRIDTLVYHDVFYNEYLAHGLEGLLTAPLADWVKRDLEGHFARRLETLRACTRCRQCELACPHHLPLLEMFDRMLADHQALTEAVRERGWSDQYRAVESPLQAPRARSGGAR